MPFLPQCYFTLLYSKTQKWRKRLRFTRDGRNGTFSPQAAIDCFADLAAEGFDQVIMIIPNVTDLECFDLQASRIIPEVERIPVAGR